MRFFKTLNDQLFSLQTAWSKTRKLMRYMGKHLRKIHKNIWRIFQMYFFFTQHILQGVKWLICKNILD